ncbi:dUTP diphosphatase [Citricoccus sp. K5]|uniref:dUTP diphosphatase n=1 Tax=Citricoccus sp. K5 TaxID=2653135 RepID=UPI0012F2BD19|nr:dUTP diphosphatase [Citricoccus sp. K5]VXB24035.1 Deoxyuridine 5'-triphosphate nucleotidohydrolase [Citricoccus sp. K5]
MNLKVKRTDPAATLPTRAHPTDAGLDLYALNDVHLYASGRAIVPTGIAVAIPAGYYGQIQGRSGLAARDGVVPAGGVIDADYRGEVQVILMNHSRNGWTAKAGDRIAQLVILPIATPGVVEVAELPGTERGHGAMGSTGK